MVDKEQLMMCSCDVINLINVLLCKLVAFLAIFFLVLVTKYADGFTVGKHADGGGPEAATWISLLTGSNVGKRADGGAPGATT